MYNLSFYFYLVLMLGIMLTVFYSIRFPTPAMSWTVLSNTLTLKLNKDYFVNFSVLTLVTPAMSAGSLVGQKMANSCTLLVVLMSVKIVTMTLLLSGVYLFYIFY